MNKIIIKRRENGKSSEIAVFAIGACALCIVACRSNEFVKINDILSSFHSDKGNYSIGDCRFSVRGKSDISPILLFSLLFHFLFLATVADPYYDPYPAISNLRNLSKLYDACVTSGVLLPRGAVN